MAIIYSILNESPKPVCDLAKDIPSGIEQILNKYLNKKLDQRYETVTTLSNDIRLIQGKPSIRIPSSKKELIKRLKSYHSVYLILGTIILVLLCGTSWILLQKKADVVQKRKSIAVLPFQNLSTEEPNAYFAVGLHNELLTQLFKVAALKVISRTSVMGYAGTSKSIRQIASEIGVGSLVEGTVQVAGQRLRVNVELIDAATDVQLWAEQYDRTLDDAFAIQSDVAQQIVAAVGVAISKIEQQRLTALPTTNAEAYRLYLQGWGYNSRPGYVRQIMVVAQELHERALALDPGFALAHAELSGVHGYMYWLRYDPSSRRAALQREEAESALRFAPDLLQAHVAMGYAYYWGCRDYRRALEEFEIALKSLPNDAFLLASIGYIHRRQGNWEKVIEAFDKATQLDPRDANLFFDIGGGTYRAMHRYAEAVHAYNRALSLVPDHYAAAIRKGWSYVLWQGQFDTLRTLLRLLPRDADLVFDGTIAAQQVKLMYWERQADSLLQVLMTTRATVFEGQDFYLPSFLYAAWAHQFRDDLSATAAAFDSVLVLVDSTLQELPDDWRVHAARGLILAGLGRRDEALREACWLHQSNVYSYNAFPGPFLAESRAKILAQLGDTSAAMEEIERLLEKPSYLSVHTLQLDPLWDPIRDHPRFKELLSKYAQR